MRHLGRRRLALTPFLCLALFLAAAAAQDGLYRPSKEKCEALVAEVGKTAGRNDIGWHISSLCSTLTMWWPGNERRCCQTLLEYVGEGGSIENCLCDSDTADLVVSSFGWLAVNIGSLNEKCEKHDVIIPYNDNAVCPPPDPNPPAPVEDIDPAGDGAESADEPDKPAGLIPTQGECIAKASEIGQSALVKSFAGCFFGATNGCCDSATKLIGADGGLENCLCDPESSSFITEQAKTYGIDLAKLMDSCISKDYEIPYNFNRFCPAAQPAEAPAGNSGGASQPLVEPSPPTPSEPTQGPAMIPDPVVPVQEEPSSLNTNLPSQPPADESQLPTLDECVAKAEDVGQAAIVSKVIPCLGGGGAACCSAALELVGKGGDLEFCLCSEESASFITDETEKLGFDLKGILADCVDTLGYELPFFGNSFCGRSDEAAVSLPEATSTSAPEEPPSQPPTDESQLPTLDECVAKAEDVGQAAIVSKVIPCLGGGGDACCSAALELVGKGGDLEFCLCSEESASFITDETEKLGFDLKGILADCVDTLGYELPFFGNRFCGDISSEQQEEQRLIPDDTKKQKPVDLQQTPLPESTARAAAEVIALPPGVEMLPSTLECGQVGSNIGEPQIIAAILPCLDEPSQTCCDAAEQLIGPTGPLAFCGCNMDLVQAVTDLAKDLGLTPEQINQYMTACPSIPLLPAGNCPDAPSRESNNLLGSRDPEERDQPTAVDVGMLSDPQENAIPPLSRSPSSPVIPSSENVDDSESKFPSWVWGAVFAAGAVAILLIGLVIYVYGFGQNSSSLSKKKSRGNKSQSAKEGVAIQSSPLPVSMQMSTQASLPVNMQMGHLSASV